MSLLSGLIVKCDGDVPAHEPLCEMLEGEECAENYPVRGPSLELSLRGWCLAYDLVRRVARQQERKPGAAE